MKSSPVALALASAVVALAAGCGSAPARPMAADLDPASPDASEVKYAVPVNPLTRRVPDMDAPEDAGEHHHHHGSAAPAPSAAASTSEAPAPPEPAR